MKIKIISGIMLTLLLTSMLTLAFNIQPVEAAGTIYIRADGSIDPPTANITTTDNVTYTLTDNITNSIVVERNNIIIDGNGHTLHGPGGGTRGIWLIDRSNVTIRNVKIKVFYYGVLLDGSSNNTISGNNITNNNYGIYLTDSSNNNTISGNNMANNSLCGVLLDYSSNNTIFGNNITNGRHAIRPYSSNHNRICGNIITATNVDAIKLTLSSSNIISENVMNGNKYNFHVYGFTLDHYVHSIDVSNLVDGKPVYYLVNQENLSINPATCPQIGWLAVVNSTNVVVENLTLTNNGQGLLFAYTRNSTIINNTMVDNIGGIRLTFFSSNNSISGNNITNNEYGIWLDNSSRNTFSGNSITNNGDGIVSTNSSSNCISGNNVTNNNWTGILLAYFSTNNSIVRNNITANNGNGISLSESSNNTVSGNNITNNNETGILVDWFSYTNTVSGNNITNNNWDGILLAESSNNSIVGNNIRNNDYGIHLLEESNYNCISGNNITANIKRGVALSDSSNNTFYHNNFIDNTQHVNIPASVNFWDNGYPSGGNYWSNYAGVDWNSGQYQNETGSDGIGDTPRVIDENNIDNYPLMKRYSDSNNIGIINITTTKTVLGQGYNLNITTTIINYGINTGTFNLTAYANTTSIKTTTNIILTGRNFTKITFTWNTTGFVKGNYTISANATILQGETDTADNNLIDGWVLVTVPGDIDGNGQCNILDLKLVKLAYSGLIDNPNADIDGNGAVNILDLKLVKLAYSGLVG